MDREHNNTYREWQRQGSPLTSKEANLEKLKRAADLSVTNTAKMNSVDGELQLDFALPRHSMKLIKIYRQRGE